MMLWDDTDFPLSPVGGPSLDSSSDFLMGDDATDPFFGMHGPPMLSSFDFMSGFGEMHPKPSGTRRMRITLANAKLQDDGAELEVEVR